jgi:hypothetical protein
MTTYRIEMMTTNHYHNFMMGGNNYWVDKVDIEANTAEEAIEIAKKNNPEMIINTNYVKTVAELEEMEAKRKAEWEAHLKAEEEKKEKAKARKIEREKAKAEELGLTIEEYRVKVKHDKKVRDTEKRIATLKMELAKEEEYLKKLLKNA